MVIAVNCRGHRSGRPVPLAPAPFDGGGEGGVFRILGDDARVAKLFAAPGRVDGELGRRLDAVVRMGIDSPHLVSVDDLLVAEADPGELVGFTMRRVAGHTVYSVTNPDERQLLGVTLTPADRVRLAEQTARAFAALHARHVRQGDAHHRNVMATFDPAGRVAGVVLLEPDTRLFEWRTGARQERFTSLARADFLPAEFQGVDLTKTPLTFASDRFALALLVSLALFDCTPFAFAGCGLTVEQRIRRGYEWLTPHLPPGATPPDRLPTDPAAVPGEVLALLRQGVSRAPAERPDAATLAAALAGWHRREFDAAAAGRTVAALTSLHLARVLGTLRRRAVDAVFATLRRVGAGRRFDPRGIVRSPGGWGVVGLKLAAVLALAGGLIGWASRPETADPGRADKKPELPRAGAAARDPNAWRKLLDR